MQITISIFVELIVDNHTSQQDRYETILIVIGSVKQLFIILLWVFKIKEDLLIR